MDYGLNQININITIFGETGTAGLLVIQKALLAGDRVTIYARNPAKVPFNTMILLPGVSFSSAGCIVLKSGQSPEECDATGFHSSSIAWFIIKKQY